MTLIWTFLLCFSAIYFCTISLSQLNFVVHHGSMFGPFNFFVFRTCSVFYIVTSSVFLTTVT